MVRPQSCPQIHKMKLRSLVLILSTLFLCIELAHSQTGIFAEDTEVGIEEHLDEIIPGDIIQLSTVKVVTEFPDGGWKSETLGLPEHTAVIYKVINKKHYKLAHQNVNGKRYVIITEVNFNNMKSGKYSIHRPVAGLIEK